MMTRPFPHRRAYRALAVAALALWAAAGCGPTADGERGPDTTASIARADQPTQKFYDYRLIESEAGVRRWILDSDEMVRRADREDVDLVRVKMEFFRDGAYFSTLVSDFGRANLKARNVFVWGNVVVTTHDGRRLRTSELHYSNQDGLIRNEVYNVFDRGPDVVTGIGLEATPDLDYIEIKQEVAAEVGDRSFADEEGRAEGP
jgi:LPS export ABC transporter protein LptC